MLDQLSKTDDLAKRRDMSVGVENYVCDSHVKVDPSDAVIGELAKLLEDAAVEYRVVGALGCLGPNAKAALPALRKAFTRAREAHPLNKGEPVLQVDYRLDFKIADAIQKISGKKEE